MGGHCQYFTVKRSHPRAKGRQCLLFTRWELSRGHLGPMGDTEAHSHLLGNWADVLIEYIPSSSAHFVFFSGRKDVQTAALQPKRCCNAGCTLGSGSSASTDCCGRCSCGTEMLTMQRGCTPLLCPMHSDRNEVLLRDRQQQPASSAWDTAQDSFRSF